MFLKSNGRKKFAGSPPARSLAILCILFMLIGILPQTALAETPMDVLYEGTMALTPGETYEVTAYSSGETYSVDRNTPLGALQTAADAKGFTYDVTDKNYEKSGGSLLLDNVGKYNFDKGGGQWYAYVNDVFKDGFNNKGDALNLIQLVNGDRVEFYYAAGISDKTDYNAVKAAATAAVKVVVGTGGAAPTDSIAPTDGAAPTDWTFQLSGAREETVTKSYFE